MARPIAFVIACIALGLALAAGWRAWDYWRLYRFYEATNRSDDIDEPLKPSVRHLQAIRKLRFSWDTRVESGGPIVDPAAPYGSADMVDDLAPLIDTRDAVTIATFNVEVSRALAWALEHGELADGRYALAQL